MKIPGLSLLILSFVCSLPPQLVNLRDGVIDADDGSPAACCYWDSGILDTYEISDVFNADMLKRFRSIKMPAFLR